MKKLLLLAITLTMTLMANAQMSVQLGYLLNTEKSKVAGVKTSDSYSGLHPQTRRTTITTTTTGGYHWNLAAVSGATSGKLSE